MKDRLEEAAAAGLVVPPGRAAGRRRAVRAHPRCSRTTATSRRRPIRSPRPRHPSPPVVEKAPTAKAPAPKAPATVRPERPAPTMPALPVRPSVNPLDAGPTGVSFTLAELSEASGLVAGRARRARPATASSSGHSVAGDTFYDGDALVVARTAAAFLRFGIEARHLRMYKVAAEREAGLHGAGRDATAQAAQPDRPPAGRRQPRRARRAGRAAPLGAASRALRDHTDLR